MARRSNKRNKGTTTTRGTVAASSATDSTIITAASAPATYIPEEILLLIASFLPGNTIAQTLTVSKKWKQLLDTDALWKQRTREELLLDSYIFGYYGEEEMDDEDDRYVRETLPDCFTEKEKYVLHFMDAEHRCSWCHTDMDSRLGILARRVVHTHFACRMIACALCIQDKRVMLTKQGLAQELYLTQQEISDHVSPIPGTVYREGGIPGSIYYFRRSAEHYLQALPAGMDAELKSRKLKAELRTKKRVIKSFAELDHYRDTYSDELMRLGVPREKAEYIAQHTIFMQHQQNDTWVRDAALKRSRRHHWSRLMYDYYFSRCDDPRRESKEMRAVIRCYRYLPNSQHLLATLDPTNPRVRLPREIRDALDKLVLEYKQKKIVDQVMDKSARQVYGSKQPEITSFDSIPRYTRSLIDFKFNFQWKNAHLGLREFTKKCTAESTTELEKWWPQLERELPLKEELERRGFEYQNLRLCASARAWISEAREGEEGSAPLVDIVHEQLKCWRNRFTFGDADKCSKSKQALNWIDDDVEQRVASQVMNSLVTTAEQASDSLQSQVFRFPATWSDYDRQTFSQKFLALVSSIDPHAVMHAARGQILNGNSISGDLEADEYLQDTLDEQERLNDQIRRIVKNKKKDKGKSKAVSSDEDSDADDSGDAMDMDDDDETEEHIDHNPRYSLRKRVRLSKSGTDSHGPSKRQKRRA